MELELIVIDETSYKIPPELIALARFVSDSKLKDGVYTHSMYGTFTVKKGKLDSIK